MLKDVRVGQRLREFGITENHRGFPLEKNLRIFGGDTESLRGRPDTLQLVGPGRGDKLDEMIRRVTPKTVFPLMMEWLCDRAILGGVNLVFFHNLNFDLRIIFYQNLRQIFEQYNDIKIERDGYVVKMLFGKVNNAQVWKDLGGYICPKCPEPVPEKATSIEDGCRVCTRHRDAEPQVRRNLGAKITLLDSAAFCPPGSKSLDAALRIYDVPYKKLPKPKNLGEKRLDLKDPTEVEYALNDARAERELGVKIMEVHKEYDVTTCVSLPQLSARILRHHFFLPGEALQFPPEPARIASEFAYHAGKNGFYVKRGVYENVYEYDINSAFPKAMKELPQMVKGTFKRVSKFMPGLVGVYRIRGKTKGGVKYPATFDHDFSPIPRKQPDGTSDPRPQAFKNVWVTGFEIECMNVSKQYDYKIRNGWVWVPKAGYKHSPLAEFVDRFWKLKATAPKGGKRNTYKNILNSLYGKFAACVEKRPVIETAFGPTPVNDPKDAEEKYFVAGALYHPFIAAQITGYVRRELYNLERRGEALHAATDSIKSFKKIPTSDDLGGVKPEVFGRCYLFRTKLYLHFAKDTSLCGHDLTKGWIHGRRSGEKKLKIFDGPDKQHLCKWALHGFKGSVEDLYKVRHKLLREGFLDYSYRHMVSLREGIRRGEDVSTMITRTERLQLTKEGLHLPAV